MERNILIPLITFYSWNKQEITTFISRYLSRLLKQQASSTPEQPSVQSGEVEDVTVLNIKAEWIQQLQDILAQLEEMTLQTRAMEESADMQAADEERIRVGLYIVNRILDYKSLPSDAERTAAEKMVREITPYKGFQRKPVGQRSSLINGLLRDAKKSEYSECISTLHLAEPIAELQRLNALYESLAEQREAKEKIKKESVTARDLATSRLPKAQHPLRPRPHLPPRRSRRIPPTARRFSNSSCAAFPTAKIWKASARISCATSRPCRRMKSRRPSRTSSALACRLPKCSSSATCTRPSSTAVPMTNARRSLRPTAFPRAIPRRCSSARTTSWLPCSTRSTRPSPRVPAPPP